MALRSAISMKVRQAMLSMARSVWMARTSSSAGWKLNQRVFMWATQRVYLQHPFNLLQLMSKVSQAIENSCLKLSFFDA
eukprot:CAMPEP_0178397984 /NCGR_PEP_ID=MMETSP0689_2-20121128/14542_1 /TAXON_ID=160604 /ORGANISM="Amphidinium massartii, Strain CS-259" /LENGTH=78 /DNA_ID=CAMNT_0020018739 /DNA_START=53 /DNA_END=289 /DNA_ORIENTATION=+